MNRLTTLLVIVAATFSSMTAQADLDIVFSSQHYRWSGKYYHHKNEYSPPEQTLVDLGSYHLYRMNPDGKDTTQITSGKYDDFCPQWSPDGKHIAYFHGIINGRCTLRISDQFGKHSMDLYRLENSARRPKFEWSPDGTMIGYLDLTWSSIGYNQRLVIISVGSGKRHSFEEVSDFAWSPNSKQISTWYLDLNSVDSEKHSFSIVDLKSLRSVRKDFVMAGPIWLTNETIMGFSGTFKDSFYGQIRKVTNNGQTVSQSLLKHEITDDPESGDVPFLMTVGQTKRVPNSNFVVYVSFVSMSAGLHHRCTLVNWKNCTSEFLADGLCIGVSPDGKSILAADRDWIGPYKRGGRRCGPIKLIKIQTGESRTLSGNLMNVEGGDWRKSPPKVTKRSIRE